MTALAQFFENMDWFSLLDFLLRIIAVLLCVVFHELCHGLAAHALGDPTAKARHRLSFNPLRHIDPLGLLMMIVVGFGWAKPVPVNPGYFKHPKRGMAVTALAGPISNFVLAYLAALVMWLLAGVMELVGESIAIYYGISFCSMIMTLSIGLGVFNLIPVPPLDGSKVLGAFLPDRFWMWTLRYERYGMLLLMAVLWLGWLDGPLWAAREFLCAQILRGAQFPYILITAGG